MTVLTEGRHPGEAIMSEANFHRSRNNVTIGESQTILANALLGKKAVPADVVATPTADSGNTASSGTIAMASPAVTSKVKDGRYTGVCSAATKVDWADPDGIPIGVSTHGSLFAKGGVRFTITAGGTPNVVGDTFYIDVAADSLDFQHFAFDPTATDGAEIPVAYSIYPVTTGSGETKKASVIDNAAELNGNDIAWPAGITTAQKANAEQALREAGIRVRY